MSNFFDDDQAQGKFLILKTKSSKHEFRF